MGGREPTGSRGEGQWGRGGVQQAAIRELRQRGGVRAQLRLLGPGQQRERAQVGQQGGYRRGQSRDRGGRGRLQEGR